MRTSGWWWTGGLVVALACVGAPARACWECDGFTCVIAESGARACFFGVRGCTTFGACGGGAEGPLFDGGDGAALQLTWIESGDPAAGPRVLRGAGRRVFGAAAVRALRSAGLDERRTASVCGAVAAFGSAFDVELGGANGDGVRLAWTAAGRGGRVTVRARAGGAAAAPLAEETLDERDVLLVPVVHEGRACTLVVQPRVLPRLAVRLESGEMQREVRDVARSARAPLDVGVAVADAR